MKRQPCLRKKPKKRRESEVVGPAGIEPATKKL